MAQYTENGAFVDLAPYAESTGVDLSPIKDSSLAGVTDANGAFYGYPTSGSCWMLFYNKELFDAKGIDYPENLTWNEYLDRSFPGDQARYVYPVQGNRCKGDRKDVHGRYRNEPGRRG